MRALFPLLLLCSAANAQVTLHASGHPNWPPFSWQSGDRIVGVGAELAEILCRDIGMQVNVKPIGNWKRVQAEAQAGRLDLIVAAYSTPERRAFLTYPREPFMEDANVVWVARGRGFPFSTWDDLKGRRGTAMLGESYGPAFDRYIKEQLTIEWVNTPEQSLHKLVLGRADYYPFSRYGGEIQARQQGLEHKVEALPLVLSKEGVYLAVGRYSRLAPYLPQLEAALAKRRADGTIEALTRKYMGLASEKRGQTP